MKTLEWNGEEWYIDDRSLWKRVRQWVIWIGGWEKPNGKGWQFHNPYDRSIFNSPMPISVVGHRLTWFGWGWQLKIKRRIYLTSSKTSGLYISNDGTPPRRHKENKGFFLRKKEQI